MELVGFHTVGTIMAALGLFQLIVQGVDRRTVSFGTLLAFIVGVLLMVLNY